MEIKKTVNGTETTLALNGWLETTAVPELQEAINGLDENTESLVLDLKGLEYISSSGLRQLVVAHKKMKNNMVVRNVPGDIMEILHLAGFDKRLNIES